MGDFCKHGIDMALSCTKCGRIKMGQVSNFEAKKNGFLRSLDRLEQTMRRLQTELANEPRSVAPPERSDQDSADASPPAPPPQRYPWQRG